MSKIACGIDLGGTKLEVGLVDDNGNIIARVKRPTHAHEGPESVIDKINDSIMTALEKSNIKQRDLRGIGIGVPGLIDADMGKVIFLTNLPGWRDIPLAEIMEEKFHIPVKLGNDADAAAYGEYLFGSGRGARNFVYMTVSTGIGGGVIIEGKLYRGASSGAAEIGHVVIDVHGEKCNCGNYGCFEALASGTAIARFAKRAIDRGKHSLIEELSGDEPIKAEHVFEAAGQGDRLALDIIDEEAFYLGIGICNIMAMYNPERIAIGGGVSNQWDMFYHKMMETVRDRALKQNAKVCRVIKAELGTDAGVVGAAALII